MSTIEFDTTRFSRRTLDLILHRAEVWQCTPAEAESRLLDELAARNERRVRRQGGAGLQ